MSYSDVPRSDGVLSVSTYDLLLALLPLLLGVGVAWSISVPAAVGAAVGGLPSALLLGYALFYRCPVGNGGFRER
ncbi:hypothetical protein ACFQE1_09960 [Halobium palmae]|uniref:Uncharacterized protein n=1 Tax=Halobium palmae TaxID=1776492 RepID=A0ABD5RZ34_9EURY